MILTGQTIENPVTGERLIFHQTAADTNGEYVLVEADLPPDAPVASAHVHPYQSERFKVLAGKVGFKIDRTTVEAGPGEVVVVEAGQAHKVYNAGDVEARFLSRISPALAFEQLIETMLGLAADGKVSKTGRANPLRLLVIAGHHFDDARLPLIPHTLQRAALALGAPLGKALGYRPVYEAADEAEAAAA
jgi:mannose-6-phosphate isomerase-like protein (cupin superfamily)